MGAYIFGVDEQASFRDAQLWSCPFMRAVNMSVITVVMNVILSTLSCVHTVDYVYMCTVRIGIHSLG